ncbi:conserved hypothetical protein [Betalipothrixvirus acidiani]|uniref:Laminin G domain-containing protein n=1 Tax=Betalipothrixvirus acidiani TaxID=346881 RepID=A7WKE3_9VIRU|nr:hypothetical protein AFV3_gp54 [Acidianus filamentous virus 3]CAJ31544.1 conserved hypothetical protein [Acidianus filamentous virus 3]
MSCGELPNASCTPTPNWECSDVECFQQCINQPTFEQFYDCCIQCALAHYIAEAKDHVTILVASAVSMIGTEYIPVFDQMQMFPAHLETLRGKEQVTVRDLVFPQNYPVKKYTYYENVQANDIGQPCSSPTGFCVPPGVTASEELWFVNEGSVVIIPSTLPPTTVSTFSYITPPPPISFQVTYPTSVPPTSIPPPPPPPPPTTITPPNILVVSKPCPEVCPGCICYYMLGIDIVDPTDAVYDYQETPTGVVQQVPQNEYVLPSDLLSIKEAPSHMTETETVEESVSFTLYYVVTTTLPVLDVNFIYPVTLIREVESVTASRSIQTVYFSYPVSKQVFSEYVTASSISVSAYFQPIVKLVQESEVTVSSIPILQIKFIKPTIVIQSVPTSVSQILLVADMIRTITPELVSEYTSAIKPIIEMIAYSVVTEVLKSVSVSASEEFLISTVYEVVQKALVPISTSASEEFLNSVIYETVKEVVTSLKTAQSETTMVSYVQEKVTPTQFPISSSQSESIMVSSVYQQITAVVSPESTTNFETILSGTFISCPFADAKYQCYTTSYTIYLFNNTSTTIPSGYPIPIWIYVDGANSTYSNVRLSYNGAEMYTWVEEIVGGSALMWVVLPTDLSTVIQIDVWVGDSSFVYDGVAGAYKEIAGCSNDNGSKIFTLYDNFCGTSLNTDIWNLYVSGDYSYEVNNDLIINVSQGQTGYVVLQSKQTFGEGYMFEVMSSTSNFITNIRTAQPSISVGNGAEYAFTDGVISSSSPQETADFSINGNCVPYYVVELGTQSLTCPSSCPSSSSSFCETSYATYAVIGINYPFRKLISGLFYQNNNVSLVVNRVTLVSSLPNQSISGNVYMYLGTAYSDATGNLTLTYHFARVYPMIAPPFPASQSGYIDNSYWEFNGVNSYMVVELPQVASSSHTFNFPVTYAVWFRTTSGNGVILYDEQSATTTCYEYFDNILQIVNGQLSTSYCCPGTGITTSGTYNDGNWHLAVVVLNPSNNSITLYVDGQEIGSVTESSGLLPPYPYYLWIGYGCWSREGSSGYFNGDIAWVAVFNTALSASQIQEIYQMGPYSIDPLLFSDNLVGWWTPWNGPPDLSTADDSLTYYNISTPSLPLYVGVGPYIDAFYSDARTTFVLYNTYSSLMDTLTSPTTGQYGGIIFSYSYTQGNVFTVSGLFMPSNPSSCPADGFAFAIFSSGFNTSNIVAPSISGCKFQGSMSIPETSSPTILVQYDPYWAEPCAGNQVGTGVNISVVNGTSVTEIVCGAGSGTFNTNVQSGDEMFYIVSYIPSSNEVCYTMFFIPNNQFVTGCTSLGSDFSAPSSGTYYLAVAGATGGQYAQWLFDARTLHISQ